MHNSLHYFLQYIIQGFEVIFIFFGSNFFICCFVLGYIFGCFFFGGGGVRMCEREISTY